MSAKDVQTQRDENESFALDVMVLDRYLAFSTELARLAVLGLGAVGYVLSKEATKGRSPLAVWVAVCAFLIAIAASLAHRYYGPDALGEMIAERRHRDRGNDARAAELNAKWRRKFSISSALIRVSALLLVVGAGAGVVAFGLQL